MSWDISSRTKPPSPRTKQVALARSTRWRKDSNGNALQLDGGYGLEGVRGPDSVAAQDERGRKARMRAKNFRNADGSCRGQRAQALSERRRSRGLSSQRRPAPCS